MGASSSELRSRRKGRAKQRSKVGKHLQTQIGDRRFEFCGDAHSIERELHREPVGVTVYARDRARRRARRHGRRAGRPSWRWPAPLLESPVPCVSLTSLSMTITCPACRSTGLVPPMLLLWRSS